MADSEAKDIDQLVERVKKRMADSGKTPADSEAKASTPVVLKGMQGWREGDPVRVQGLQSAAGQKLNGKTGVIESFIEATGRFQVTLASGDSHSLKADNLRYNDGGSSVPPAPVKEKRAAASDDSGSSSESSQKKRTKKRKKKIKATFSNFTNFDAGGAAFSGKTREEMSAEEKLNEMLNGPMSATERDQYVRMKTAQAKQQEANTAPTPAAGALKVGDPVTVHGLQSESGQKMNGRSGIICDLIESSGRFQVQLGPGEAPALKRDNLKYNSSVPEWMRD